MKSNFKSWRVPGSAMVSSYGNVNYSPADPRESKFKAYLKNIFNENSDYVIIDGDDDWYAPPLAHPSTVTRSAGITTVGTFHSGTSGLSYSGIVIMRKDYDKFVETFKELCKVKSNLERPASSNSAFMYAAKYPVQLNVYMSDEVSIVLKV